MRRVVKAPLCRVTTSGVDCHEWVDDSSMYGYRWGDLTTFRHNDTSLFRVSRWCRSEIMEEHWRYEM